ncbi:MAG: universal stress protein [Thaumarchaeota archaeon]|nr:universal stress protein [Nitrososphaerota archaeon]
MSAQQTASEITLQPNYSKILVGYDGSKNSTRALARAAALAREHGATLSVLVVVNTTLFAFAPMAPPAPEEFFEDLIKNGQETLAQAIKIAGSVIPGVTGAVKEGNAGECILNLAASNGIDLIVIGRRGISGMERFLLGGVSSNVVAHSKCDVLIVK